MQFRYGNYSEYIAICSHYKENVRQRSNRGWNGWNL
jgi:hypothetical protein